MAETKPRLFLNFFFIDPSQLFWIVLFFVTILVSGSLFIVVHRSNSVVPVTTDSAPKSLSIEPLIMGRFPGIGHLSGSLETLIGTYTQDFERLHINQNIDGHTITIGKEKYSFGIGTHAKSRISLLLEGRFTKFSGLCGVDMEVGRVGTVVFKILNGSKVLFASPLMKGGDAARAFNMDVSKLDDLDLIVEDGGDGINFDRANWVNLSLK